MSFSNYPIPIIPTFKISKPQPREPTYNAIMTLIPMQHHISTKMSQNKHFSAKIDFLLSLISFLMNPIQINPTFNSKLTPRVPTYTMINLIPIHRKEQKRSFSTKMDFLRSDI